MFLNFLQTKHSLKMVLINLSKLMMLIQCIQNCPLSIPKRVDKLFDSYFSFKPTSDDLVSIHIPVELERLKERNVDDEEETKKKKIITEIIHIYSKSPIEFPSLSSTTIYLIPPISKCLKCSGALITVRPHRKGRGAVVYTVQGPTFAEVYHKYCKQCNAVVYYCYTEFREEGNIFKRKYLKSGLKYFSATQDTYFEFKLLEDLTEDLFTCDTRFHKWVMKYNRTFRDQKIKLIKNRVFPVWVLYSIQKRIPVEFNVSRKADRSFDIEAACKILYPALKEFIDGKWISHKCSKCTTRLVVMGSCQNHPEGGGCLNFALLRSEIPTTPKNGNID